MPELELEQAAKTTAYLRPRQVTEMEEERGNCMRAIHSPSIENKKPFREQLRRIDSALEKQTPPSVQGAEKDRLVETNKALLEKILVGMPSQEEMRKNPPGAVGKHIAWERRNKENIKQWKNTQLILNKGTSDNDIANLERYRPHHTSSDLSMVGAQIPGKKYYMPQGELDIHVADEEYIARVAAEKNELTAKLIEIAVRTGDWELARFAGLDKQTFESIQAQAADLGLLEDERDDAPDALPDVAE